MTRALLALLTASFVACSGVEQMDRGHLDFQGDANESSLASDHDAALRNLIPAGFSGSAGHASDAPQVAGLAARARPTRCGTTAPATVLCHDYPTLDSGQAVLAVRTDRHPGRVAIRVQVAGQIVGESAEWVAPVGSAGATRLVAPCPGCQDGTGSLHLGWPDADGQMAWAVAGQPIPGSPEPTPTPGPDPVPEPEPPPPDDAWRAKVDRTLTSIIARLVALERKPPSTGVNPVNLKGGE